MELVSGYAHDIFWFLVVLTLVVFVHELGHYSVAKICGVKVEVFSVGFGRELFGLTDKAGTRWKFSILPLGGYVKFFGDLGYAGEKDYQAEKEMSHKDRSLSFQHKSLGQKTAIVAAGPVANFVLAIVISVFIFSIFGRPNIDAIVDEVVEGSEASAVGIQPGDQIVQIGNKKIRRFQDVQQIVMFNPGKTLNLVIERGGALINLYATPRSSEIEDPATGIVQKIGLLGIKVKGGQIEELSLSGAMLESVTYTYTIAVRTLQGIGQILVGERSPKELGGPITIGQISGAQAANGPGPFFQFVVILSVTLGLINFFPIPMLDGGHLLFYFVELVRGKPLGAKSQEYCFRIGFLVVIFIMGFAIFNDLSRFFS